MPQARRRSAGSASVAPLQTDGSDAAGQFVGVDDRQLQSTPEEFFGEWFKGLHFRKQNIPSRAPAGGTVRLTGVVHFDAATVQITKRGGRVRVLSPHLSQAREQTFTDLRHCKTRRFSIEIPVPDTPGSEISVRLKAGHTNPVAGGYATDSTIGPFRIQVLSEGELQRAQAIDALPWAIGGAGAGLLVDNFRGGNNTAAAAIGGGAGGVALRALSNSQVGNVIPQVDPVPLALAGAGLAGIGIFLNQSGASEVLQPAGEAAGQAIDAGRKAISSDSDRRALPSGR